MGDAWPLVVSVALAVTGVTLAAIAAVLRRRAERIRSGEPAERPLGVWLVYDDGTERPVEVEYLCRDERGWPVWMAVAPDDRAAKEIKVGVLPGHCTIVFIGLEGDDEDGR